MRCSTCSASPLFAGFIGLTAWYGFGVFQTSHRLGAQSLSPLGTPLVVPQLLWVLGLVMFLWVALLLVRSGADRAGHG